MDKLDLQKEKIVLDEMDLQEYIKDPCRISSLPYWKAKEITVPEGMLIIHEEQYQCDSLGAYDEECYFRIKHNLKKLQKPKLPAGYSVVHATASEYAKHLNECYPLLFMTEEFISTYFSQTVYPEELRVAVRDAETKKIVASGIAAFDVEAHEGTLEWIQVTEAYRGKGLGQFIVNELLQRMKEKADFVTVSGEVDNKTRPERLYRRCGFTGTDVWHILRPKEQGV